MLVIPNFGEWRVYRAVVSSWLPYVSGGMEEMFTKYGETPGSGYFIGGDWDAQLALPRRRRRRASSSSGSATPSSTDQAAARYGWATMLLAANGNASFALHRDYTNETWFAEYDYDLGSPTGAETKLASGIHRRVYGRGLVLVNPTNSSVAVSFGGRYRGSGLTARTSTVMGPHTGLILVADSVAAPAAAKPAAPVFQAVVVAPPGCFPGSRRHAARRVGTGLQGGRHHPPQRAPLAAGPA